VFASDGSLRDGCPRSGVQGTQGGVAKPGTGAIRCCHQDGKKCESRTVKGICEVAEVQEANARAERLTSERESDIMAVMAKEALKRAKIVKASKDEVEQVKKAAQTEVTNFKLLAEKTAAEKTRKAIQENRLETAQEVDKAMAVAKAAMKALADEKQRSKNMFKAEQKYVQGEERQTHDAKVRATGAILKMKMAMQKDPYVAHPIEGCPEDLLQPQESYAEEPSRKFADGPADNPAQYSVEPDEESVPMWALTDKAPMGHALIHEDATSPLMMGVGD
jgi:hypothetical protein